MRTRNSDTPKPAPTKKTPPIKKNPPSKSSTKPTPATSATTTTPKTGSTSTPKQIKTTAATASKLSTTKVVTKPKVEKDASLTPEIKVTLVTSKPKVEKDASSSTPKVEKVASSPVETTTTPEIKVTPPVATMPKVEEGGNALAETVKVTPKAKGTPKARTVVVKKKIVKMTSAAAKAKAAAAKPALVIVDETVKKEEEPVVENVNEPLNKEEEEVVGGVDESLKKEESVVAKVGESLKEKEKDVMNDEEDSKKEEISHSHSVESPKNVESEPVDVKEEEQMEKEDDVQEAVDDTMDPVGNVDNMEEDVKEDTEGKEVQLDEEDQDIEEEIADYGEEEGFEEPAGDEECSEDDQSEPDEEAKGLDEENREISALAKERKIKKEREIFVGGLDRDAGEEDVRKVFESVGEVIEVRLNKNPSSNKNKGYAFVKFANKEQANKALSEIKNPVIRGKRCGVAPSEDNDTLFVGNICNTWTKEAIKKKLKEYGLEGVENITLVADARHEGLSRGFSFVEFSCHVDAMLAYKRLQKPDAVFGHAERTVKVAFAEPLREPDPEIMAQVKSVFVDGLPPYWDEDRVREHFKPYGEIERIVLARNMPSAKRKDFGFVDFTTHGAAITCIDGVNNTELGDEKSKSKVKVRLSNPLPKTQAVKGGLCGGFRIGRPGSGFSRFGRGNGRGGRPFNRVNFQRGNDFHARGRGRTGRFSSPCDIVESPYTEIRVRRPVDGRGGFGGQRGYNEEFSSRAAPPPPSRPDLGRSRYASTERGRGRYTQLRRQPYSPEGRFSRPVGARHYVDDPYLYEDGGYGLKRPYSMVDHDPGYLEPSRLRPRFDQPDLVMPSRETRYQDSFGAGSSRYPPDYYNSAYSSGAYSPMYGADRSYGGGYYF
ncbi:hypothetical protein IFM89_037957 [Coptis chinensis]|uniref:RRM domain-containing protein n=1 Tax=Coptis chinensis TaxID=261450 RepID=A0A835HV34_9MAGN|nr:hypothetical protein IFM89_037957 [Coptis chinensis]